MTKELAVLLAGERIGGLSQGASGMLELAYEAAYQRRLSAMPISLSMPLTRPGHSPAVVRAFCQGLLPDNENVLERWARDFQVSAGNPFALLANVGEDCAGAVQFVRSERVDEIRANVSSVVPLADEQIAARVRTLRLDPSAWHMATAGQFSLAGAQAKTALHLDRSVRQWGDPSGAVPTTHILKPAIAGFDDHDLNEHLCLTAARIAGLWAATSRVLTFGAERAIVVDRYDRQTDRNGSVARIHQEDMCQALGISPSAKYQSDGGPSPEQIIELLRRAVVPARVAEQEVDRFVDALALN